VEIVAVDADAKSATNRFNVVVLRDTDRDGTPDRDDLDDDGDGLTDVDEAQRGTNPLAVDTDDDGLRDGAELTAGTNPLNPDTDGDGIPDGSDPNPLASDDDQDGDGIADKDDPDIDGDNLLNTDEVTRGTDPRKRDTDADGWPDGFEVEASSDPRDAASIPALFFVSEPEVRMVLPAAPPLELQANLLFVAEPEVRVILPTSPTADLALSGVTLAEPAVSLILPSSPEIVPGSEGVTVGEPTVELILPRSPELVPGTEGITVSEPLVELILPRSPELVPGTEGVTVSEPEVNLILPTEPILTAASSGVTVSEPVVFLRLDLVVRAAASRPTLGTDSNSRAQSATRPIAFELRLVEYTLLDARSRPAAAGSPIGRVLLEWSGPAEGRYLIDSSVDLQEWTRESVEPVPAPEGLFRAHCLAEPSGARFYRVRLHP